MTFSLYARSGLTVLITAALSSTAWSGSEAVDPSGPVFVPPVFIAPTGAPSGGGSDSAAQPSDNSGSSEGEAAASASETARAEQQAQQTATATNSFNEAQLLCLRISDVVYGVDCLADQLAQYATDLPQGPEYAQARQIVEQTAGKLRSVARRNASKTKRPARLREATDNNPKRSSRPIIPVAPERLNTANTEATAILREAETMLLRAAEQSERRKVAFSQIAEAVGSSTILLRSS